MVSQHLAKKVLDVKQYLKNNTELAKVLAPRGRPLREGDWITRPQLATTLDSIASEGADVFYKGWIAESLLETLWKNGGIMTAEDMANYKPLVKEALSTTYRGRKVTTCPLPTG